MNPTNFTTRLAVPGAAFAALALVSGCGSGANSAGAAHDAGTTTPSAAHAQLAQLSASALSGVAQSSATASDAIVQGGTRTSASTRSVSGTAAAAPFSFTDSGTFTVDLDERDGAGADRFPNATGSFTVAYSGSVVGSQPSGTGGTAGYDVALTYDTDVVFTDPASGARATIDRGSSITYGLELTWNRPDATHWTLATDAQLTVPGWSGSLVQGADTATGAHHGHRHETRSLTYDAGALTYVPTVDAHWQSTVTKDGVSHTVVWDRPAIDQITVTVDGTSYGPYTRAQVAAVLHATVD